MPFRSSHIFFLAYVYVALVTVQLSRSASGGRLSSYIYKKQTVCAVQEQKDRNCLALGSPRKLSVIQCTALCREKTVPFCYGTVMNQLGECYLHLRGCDATGLDTTSASACSPDDASYSAYSVLPVALTAGSCLNYGVFDPGSQSCQCPLYWLGPFCERYPTSCRELRDEGYPYSDHWVDMNLLGRPEVTRVKCQIGADFVRTYISTSDGIGDFNRTFQEYKDGFLMGSKSFWLGLDNVHRLTGAGLNTLTLNLQVGGVPLSTTYNDVIISGEDQNYAIDYTSVILNRNDLYIRVEECLTHNVAFSTWDRDNDGDPGRNLSLESGSGWWHRDLSVFCNPNGKAPTAAFPSDLDQLDYVAIKGANLSYNALGKDFDFVAFYFEQPFP